MKDNVIERNGYTVQRLENEVPLAEYLAECVDVPKFLAFCRECPNYGVHWSCAPFDFDPMEIWAQYDHLRLVALVLLPGSDMDLEGMLRALHVERDRLLEELLELERANPGALALSGGSCTRCQRCTRLDGVPCRFPERMRYSIEALGGDVGRTASQYLHKPLLWIQDNTVPAYMMTVGGLLLKERA